MLANIAAVLGDCRRRLGRRRPQVAIFLTDLGNFAAVNALYEGAIGAHRPRADHRRGRGAARRRALVEIECWVYLPA